MSQKLTPTAAVLLTLPPLMWAGNAVVGRPASRGLRTGLVGLVCQQRRALGRGHIQWGWPLVAALIFIAVGPALLAYRAWVAGVGQAGPVAAGFFSNLTPLFTALLSTAVLGEAPHLFHVLAFGLIVSGIVVSSRR